MIEAFKKLIRSYSDALFAGLLKTGADGQRVFYPWGLFGSGYVVSSGDEEERLKTSVAVHLVAVVIVMSIALVVAGWTGAFVGGALVFAAYAVWLRRATATMARSNERMSLAESYRAQAVAHGSARLWSWMVVGVFLVGLGLGAIVMTPGDLGAMSFLIGIGVLVMAFAGYMLMLRRGAPPPSAGTAPAKKSVLAEELATAFTGDIGPVGAWFITIVGLVFTGLGLVMIIVDPEERSNAAGMTALFGLVAAFGIAMLVLRRRRLREH